jgi:hypothetical protein
MPTVRFYNAQMDWLLHSPSGTTGRWLARRGNLIVRLAKLQVGVDTGALRQSIHMRHFRDPRGQYLWIGSRLDHALVHHEGARPHIIVPKQAKVLRFVSRGQVMFANKVVHPGHRRNKYLSGPMDTVIRTL